jgi:hypothetical protein
MAGPAHVSVEDWDQLNDFDEDSDDGIDDDMLDNPYV